MCGRSQKVLWNEKISDPCALAYGVPQGSILGPTLFLVMIADMPRFVIGDMANAKMTGYADDSTVYVHTKHVDELKTDLEILSNRMISYCQSAGLILNNNKTQLLVSPKQKCQIQMGSSVISAASEISLLGVDFDTNFTTTPYLHKLARAANTRTPLINRLSFSMPPHLLTTFANGLLMGKILAACSVTIPDRIDSGDRYNITVTEEINKAIKATSRIITKTKISDKIRSEDTLKRANLKCLNKAVASIVAITVWKANRSMNQPILFQPRIGVKSTRSETSNEIRPPVPGYSNLASNIMARVWNSIPELQNASTLCATISRKWARGIPR